MYSEGESERVLGEALEDSRPKTTGHFGPRPLFGPVFGEDVSPDVTVLGPDGDPDVAVVGGIHGDEPSGVRAVRRAIESEPDLRRPVKFIVANPPAVASHRRYLDADLNRVFPGDPDSDDRERRLAPKLLAETTDTVVLSIHSTHSHDEPMAFVSRKFPRAQALAAQLPVPYVVDPTPAVGESFATFAPVVSVEAGYQRTEAATENASDLVEAFLRLTDALPGEPDSTDTTFLTMEGGVAKDPDREYELLVDNFEPVEEGTVVARSDGEEFVADDRFVPILMSETGYDDLLGYRGTVVGETLDEARDAWGIDVDVAD